MSHYMKERFRKLWVNISPRTDFLEEYRKLVSMYTEPNRFYHNLNHIKNGLSELDSVKHLMVHPEIVEFAFWYHDAIYDPRRDDSTEKSAHLAFNTCMKSKISERFADEAKRLILVMDHEPIKNGIDSKIIMDADIAIFGKAPEEFKEYEQNIRKEYSFLSDDKFKKGRRQVIGKFYTRENIFHTDLFRANYEWQARKNLKRTLDTMTGPQTRRNFF